MENKIDGFSLDEIFLPPSEIAKQAIVLQQRLEDLKLSFLKWIKSFTGGNCVIDGPHLQGLNGETQFCFTFKFSDGFVLQRFYQAMSRYKCSYFSYCHSSGEACVHLNPDQFNALFEGINQFETTRVQEQTLMSSAATILPI